ncbi:5-hydroxytryptamine receptor 3A-like [Dunckerocampus dactyliophorus]|uniref:5-hydroxytryptamine receptor 3A-like n=1 Tax=Dunckerocampus dactyliophorus TaxID=161453 RepID=UPI002404BEF9|nr:5-hydroxytryptamine receptor 3A-like [Dunckerocampus dactyliophorus]
MRSLPHCSAAYVSTHLIKLTLRSGPTAMSGWSTLALLVFTASCGTALDCSYETLLSHLKLSTSNDLLSIMRPVKNWTETTRVRLDMLLYGIIEVDEKSQTLTSHVWIQMIWKSDFLTWTPSKFCGIEKLAFPKSKLWIPDIIIQEDTSDTGSITASPFVTVHSNGMMQMYIRQRLTSTCTLDLYNFPFDKQSCEITFRSMNFNDKGINLGTISSDDIISDISEQIMVTRGEWRLEALEADKNVTTGKNSNPSQLIYQVRIVRKPMLYIIIFIVPLLCLLFLDLTSFFISEARGEKLSFKITVLLSISVLLLILKDMLPSTEEKLPLIASYCIGVFALVGFSVLEAMLVSFLIDMDNAKTVRSPDNSCMDVHVAAEKQKEPMKDTDDVKLAEGQRPSERDLMKMVLQEVRACQQEVGKGGAVKPKPSCYRRAAGIIDAVYFCLYICTVGIFVVTTYHMWVPHGFFE